MEIKKEEIKKSKKQLKNYAIFSSMAAQMIATIGIGAYAGYKLDEYFEFKFKIFTFCLTVIAVILSIYSIIKRVIDNNKEKDK